VLDGRQFLTATTGLAATLAFRSPLLAQLEKAPANLPDHSLLDKNEGAYWAELRQPFLIPLHRNDSASVVLGTTHKISTRARDAQKLPPFPS
jgi:hypothetical protein